MAVEQHFTLAHPGGDLGKGWELTREQAETLWTELGEALGYSGPPGAAVLDQDAILAALATSAGITLDQIQREYQPMTDDEYVDGGMPFEEQQGRPAGPTRTLSAEAMQKAMEKRLAAEQVAVKRGVDVQGGRNRGSGIGSGKP